MPIMLIFLLIGSLGMFATGYEVRGWKDDAAQLAFQKAQTVALAAAAVAARAQQAAGDKISYTIGLSFAQEQLKIIGLTITQIQRVPFYVPAKADAACTINTGFVLLHDAAARGDDPAATVSASGSGALDTPASARLSDVGAKLTVNYGKYHQVANELLKLQKWYSDQKALSDGAQPK